MCFFLTMLEKFKVLFLFLSLLNQLHVELYFSENDICQFLCFYNILNIYHSFVIKRVVDF